MKKGMSGKGGGHPGFAAAQNKIAASQDIPLKNAGAILASKTRKASPAAKKANPRLAKVKGGMKYVKK